MNVIQQIGLRRRGYVFHEPNDSLGSGHALRIDHPASTVMPDSFFILQDEAEPQRLFLESASDLHLSEAGSRPHGRARRCHGERGRVSCWSRNAARSTVLMASISSEAGTVMAQIRVGWKVGRTPVRRSTRSARSSGEA